MIFTQIIMIEVVVFINTPCSWRTHPGNPSNLECTDEALELNVIELERTRKIEHHKAYDRVKNLVNH